MKDTAERVLWPDICKGFAIILVIVGHAIGYTISWRGADISEIQYLLEINRWIYSFHMPLFFFVSGYLQRLSENRNKKQDVRRKIIAIIGPYVIFSAIYWLFKKIFNGSVNNPVTLQDFFLIWIFPLSDLWFLYALASFYIFRLCIVRSGFNEKAVFITTVLLAIISMSVAWNESFSHSALPRMCKYLCFYNAGALFLNLNKKSLSKQSMVVLSLILFIVGIAGLFLAKDCQGILKGIINFLVAFCNISATFITGNLIHSKILQFFGSNSLYVFLAHDYAVCALVILCSHIIYNVYYMCFLATVFGVIFSVLVIKTCDGIKIVDYLFRPQLLFEQRHN